MIKVTSFIERVALKRVGFSCWVLFTINYFRCYEVSNNKYTYTILPNHFDIHIIFLQILSFMAVLFLKVVEVT